MQTIEILESWKYRVRIWDNDGYYTVSCFSVEKDGQVLHFPSFHKHYEKISSAYKQAEKFFKWANPAHNLTHNFI